MNQHETQAERDARTAAIFGVPCGVGRPGTYAEGWAKGVADSSILDKTPGEDGYTIEEYRRISAELDRAQHTIKPLPFDEGYADAFDYCAYKKGFTGRRDDDDRWERLVDENTIYNPASGDDERDILQAKRLIDEGLALLERKKLDKGVS